MSNLTADEVSVLVPDTKDNIMDQVSTGTGTTSAKSPELDEIIKKYGCGPIQFTGTPDALYERVDFSLTQKRRSVIALRGDKIGRR